MNTILNLTDQDFEPSTPIGDRDSYFQRGAARAVVMDGAGRVAVMHASNSGYYKLPGGGIDDGEQTIPALHREIREEVGAKITVDGEVGIVHEYRDYDRMEQTSYAYMVTVDGQVGSPTLTEKELREGFEVVWADNIDAAIELIKSSETHSSIGIKFMNTRDVAILQAAKKLLS